MTILITGGAGFIGSHLTDALIAAGHSCVVLDNVSTGSTTNIPAAASFINGDICDRALVDRVFAEHPIDGVFHLAAAIDARASLTDPIHDATVNILGSLHLLEAARQHRLQWFVFASSGGVMYGDQAMRPTPETTLPQPAAPYGVAKLTVDNYLDIYKQIHGLRTVSLRLANVYGPRQNPASEAGVFAIFIDHLLNSRPVTINGDGSVTRDYLYIDDVVAGFLLAMNNADMAGVYNVGTGIETSVNQLYSIIQKACNSMAVATHGPAKPEQQHSSLDSSRIAALGWSAQTDIAAGISKTVDWFSAK